MLKGLQSLRGNGARGMRLKKLLSHLRQPLATNVVANSPGPNEASNMLDSSLSGFCV